MIINSPLWVFGRHSRKLDPTQRKTAIVTFDKAVADLERHLIAVALMIRGVSSLGMNCTGVFLPSIEEISILESMVGSNYSKRSNWVKLDI